MKQFNQPFKVLLFLTIYCFGIFVSVKTLPSSITQTTEQNNKQKEYNTNVSNNLFVHTQQSENLLSAFTEYGIPTIKLSNTAFGLILFSNDLFFKTKFKQYQNYYKSLLLRNRKTNLIFPFHNFW